MARLQMKPLHGVAFALFVVVVGTASSAAAGLQITSTAFPANGAIPSKYTCDGPGMNPPLAFSGVPAKAQSLVSDHGRP